MTNPATTKPIRFRPWHLPLLVALYIGLFLNYPFYRKLAEIFAGLGRVDPGFVLSIPLFVCSVLTLLFTLLCWGPQKKPLLCTLVVLSSLASYGSLTYGVVFDYGMIENIAETHSGEALAYLTPQALLWFLVTALLPSVLIWRAPQSAPGRIRSTLASLAVVLACLASVVSIALVYYQDYASVGRNNNYLKSMIIPTHALYSGAKYLSHTYLAPPQPFKVIGQDAHRTTPADEEKPDLLVLVVGETARAQNLAHYGYQRDTNPFTRARGVIPFQDVSSCGTATSVSVPCMFSPFTRDNYDATQARNQSNLMDLLDYAGLETLWLENDGGSKGVADRIPMLMMDPSEHPKWCDGSVCVDQVMLSPLKRQLRHSKKDGVIVLHLIGSHGPTYFKRYPKEMGPFTPACEQASIENCSEEELVNVYDNTLYYTDYVLSQVIDALSEFGSSHNTALLYLSDHGESLGENGLYLHGFPYSLAPKEQTQVPMLFWSNQSFAASKGLDNQCLKRLARHGSFSHDNLFHSVLGLMSVGTSLYDRSLDIFASCMAPHLQGARRG
ncbi:phosphoethanolamine--lipid A transferase [Ferrimonas sp. YFM]|uniref:phosphoethanolamine transferase n=1 Tax=Ferrimonas sp. YFM TaxID=3028878 RepID=UPI0025731A1B|nr:phosphoethanolamine--lipid A transferase [Ferrimonas sp. YFM]BDY04954.1 phosphoethanolamine transferase [Ferrimonas sp. YFM]